MSNHLAIATVTSALQGVLQQAVGRDVAGATATIVRPDSPDNQLPNPGVNAYLYQATPNHAWRNSDLPTRSPAGDLVQRPRVPLDLHYLLTFYGSDTLLEPHQVLGSVARVLHARPVLTRSQIEATIQTAIDSDPGHFLGNSDLSEEVELVKFVPVAFSLEELSKLWSVFFQTPYRLSIAYLASTVLIETDESTRRALPVKVRSIVAAPFSRPRVDQVVSSSDVTEPIVINSIALLKGERLDGEAQTVRVGNADLTPSEVRVDRITVQLTDAELRAGVQGLRVLYASGAESNVAPLMLHPAIRETAPDQPDITVANVVTDPDDGTRSGDVSIGIDPLIGPTQRVVLYLNERDPVGGPGRAYSFPAEARPADSPTAGFRLHGVESGTYLARVQVGGAETLLETDPNGAYREPAITIP